MIIIPRDYQEQAVNSLFDYFHNHNEGNPIVAMPTGCHAPGHKILMANGTTKNVENIEIGDSVAGLNGVPRKVLELHSGVSEMFKITPINGTAFTVNADHILNLYRTNEKSDRKKPYEYINISVRDYLSRNKLFKHIHKLHRSTLNFKKKQVLLDPWLLGFLLGDGNLSTVTPGVTIADADSELLTYIKEATHKFDVKVIWDKVHKTKCKSYRFTGNNTSRSVRNKLTVELERLKVNVTCAFKSIPNQYKFNCKQIQNDVLSGILDSDGSYDGKCFDFISKSEQLSKDVVFLAKSLGLKAQVNRERKSCQNNHSGFYYRVCISGNLEILNNKSIRRQAKPRRSLKKSTVTGFNVEPVGIGKYFGFEIDGDHLYMDNDFIVHHNSGKAIVIATFIERVLKQWSDQNILITTHVKELVKQNHDRMLSMWPTAPVGIFSSGLKRRDLYRPITFSGIGSIYRYPSLFAETDLMIIDECDLVSPDQATMYQKFITAIKEFNPYLRVIGLTATPWRTKQGMLTDDDGLFTDVCFDMTSPEAFIWLIDEGYLIPLVPKKTGTFLDASGVKTTAGEFNQKQLQMVVDTNELTTNALREICQLGQDRNSWLIFCAGVDHSVHTSEILNSMGVPCGVVHSGNKDFPMDTKGRDKAISDFGDGMTTGITNNSVLSVGYDNPKIDLIGHLKPEKSSRGWIQELGRGTRPLYAPGFDLTTRQGRLDSIYKGGKHNCLVLDFGRNTPRLGAINDPVIPKAPNKRNGDKPSEAPIKECPNCDSYIAAAARECIHCGYEFEILLNISRTAGTEELISKGAPDIQIFDVDHVTYSKYVNKKTNANSMRVSYFSGLKKFNEFVHIENRKAQVHTRYWWVIRSSDPMPATVDQALIESPNLKVPTSLSVWVNKDYPEIVKHIF